MMEERRKRQERDRVPYEQLVARVEALETALFRTIGIVADTLDGE